MGESNVGKSKILSILSEILISYELEGGVTNFSLEMSDSEYILPHNNYEQIWYIQEMW